MTILLLNLLPVALLGLLFWGARPVRPFASAWNEDYLSVNSCEALRGFFAVVVIFHHLQYRTTSGTFFHLFARDGFLPVAIFFFFSGYGLLKQYITRTDYAKGFLVKRLPPVLFPYIIITVIYWVVYACLGEVYSLPEIMTSLVNGSPFVPFSWYIISILAFYVVFWFLMRICGENVQLMLVGTALWCVANIVFCMKMDYPSWWYNATHLLVIGMLWAVYEQRILTFIRKTYGLIAPLVWIAFIVLFCAGEKIPTLIPVNDCFTIVAMCSALLLTLSVILFVLKFSIGNPILKYLGKISLELYISQGIFMMCFHSDRVIDIQLDLLYSVLCIIATVIFSGILHVVNQRILSWYRHLIK